MISTYFEQRNWANGEADKLARLQRYWKIQGIRTARNREREERKALNEHYGDRLEDR